MPKSKKHPPIVKPEAVIAPPAAPRPVAPQPEPEAPVTAAPRHKSLWERLTA